MLIDPSVRLGQAAIDILCGEYLGGGSSRQVYALRFNPDYVIKVERRINGFDEQFDNVIEWEMWRVAKNSAMRHWFAPCDCISSDGSLLIMKRTTRAAPEKYPTTMPAFFSDFQYANYGLIGKQLVCHDYGHSLFEKGLSPKMKKVTWR